VCEEERGERQGRSERRQEKRFRKNEKNVLKREGNLLLLRLLVEGGPLFGVESCTGGMRLAAALA
jgi:hypothetical protein